VGGDGASVGEDFWAGQPATAETVESWTASWSDAEEGERWVPPAAGAEAPSADTADEDPLAAMVREAVDRVIAADTDT
jgi:hypothetical protein